MIAVFVVGAVQDALPGAVTASTALPWLPLVGLPAALAWLHRRRLRRLLLNDVPRRSWLRRAARLQTWSVPLCVAASAWCGSWPAYVAEIGVRSEAAEMALLLLPPLMAEVGLRLTQTPTAAVLRRRDLDSGPVLGTSALGGVWFLSAPFLVFAVVADVLALSDGLAVFLRYTTVGQVIGTLVAIPALLVLLPIAFRVFLRTSTHLPPRFADELRQTASSLGFRPGSVLSMNTGHRMANAAMVGPLPWPRYLVLTDALMSLLDIHALKGVVAHEGGHARRGHTGLLLVTFALAPITLLYAVSLLEWIDEDGASGIAVPVVVLVASILCLRLVSHRFEHEADVASAEALGGARPCIRALTGLGRALRLNSERASWLHPSENRRVQSLLKWESDEGFRERFEQRGRALRFAVAGVTLGVATLLTLGLARTWPLDRIHVAFLSGDFASVSAELDEMGDAGLPGAKREYVDELREETRAALSVLDESERDGTRWFEVRSRLADSAWSRALGRLGDGDVRGARPWLSLALFTDDPTPVQRSLYRLSRAVADEDVTEQQRLREHLRTLVLDGGDEDVRAIVERL